MKDSEDFASNIALETADDLGLGHPLPSATLHIRLGPLVMTEPDNHHPMESGVGLAVAAPVKPVPVGLARGRGDRTDPAQRGKGRLGSQTLGVAPRGDQEGSGNVGADAEGSDQGRCRL